MIDAYFTHLLIIIGIYLIVALSLQLSIGFAGLLNLGHIAFYAIGAYASALLSRAGLPFWFCFLSAGVLVSLSAYLLSLATNKHKGDYLALVTLGFSFMISAILTNWTRLTGGSLGLSDISRPTLFGKVISGNSAYLVLVLIVVVLTYVIIKIITVSPYGKLIQATRDDELAAKTLGKQTWRAKSLALVISAFFAGIAGSLFAHYISYIDPTIFTFTNLVPILVIVMVGGLGSLEGTIIATIIVVLIPELIGFIGLPSSVIGAVRQLAYALFLLAIILFQPKGFDGKVQLE